MKVRNSLAVQFLAVMLCIVIMTNCKKDDPPCATWDTNVKAIIESSCSYSGCHSGGATANSFIPEGSNDFTTYASIKSVLDNGSFEQRSLVAQNMPPAMFVPPGNPTELTQAQIDVLQCWADEGFPEN